jgi:hypothetical protein
MRLQYDALTFQWQKWVIGFNGEQQFEFLQRYMGRASAKKFAMVILGSFALVLVPVALVLLFRRPTRQLDALDRDYLVFCDRLGQKGVDRLPGETPEAFARRAADALPGIADQVKQVTRMYNQLAYSAGLDPQRRKAIQRDFSRSARRIGRRQPRGIV